MMTGKLFTFVICLLAASFTAARSFEEENVIDNDKVTIETSKEHRVQRDVRPVEFDIGGKHYKFNFELSDRDVYSRYIPVWLAKSKPGNSPNYTYELVPDTSSMITGHIYVDNDKKAVVFARYDAQQKKILYDGVFGESKQRHVIKSNAYRRLRSGRNRGDHTVYKTNEEVYYSLEKRPNDVFTEKLDKPLETLYPKLLVVVDNHLFQFLGSDIGKTLRYLATFWNAVDQKYSTLESPKVQIMVTGVIIANDETALNYVYQTRNDSMYPDDPEPWANADRMLEKMRLYFHHNFSNDADFRNYDAAVVMTGLSIYPIGGVTHMGKICDNWYNDAVVKDDGTFGGVRTATHELAHLLNVSHDNYSKEGECAGLKESGDVAIMSPWHVGTNNLFWSDCSKNYMREFAKVKASECLENRFRERHYEEDEYYIS